MAVNLEYDVIVIGSGAGGLTAAVALAQAGKKVLVLEQHDRPGGWTHSFTKHGYRFSPGVHYIGSLEEGGALRRIYDGLGVSQDLVFCELNPEGYDHIYIGERRVDFPRGRQNLLDRLKTHFPHEAAGIDSYFKAVDGMMDTIARLGDLNQPANLGHTALGVPSLLKWMRLSGGDLIRSHVNDPILCGVLAGQAGDHGQPPSQVSAFIHAGIMRHYYEGAYYPRGGAFTIPRAFVQALKQAGGEIRLQARVSRILLERDRVLGVELETGEQIRSQYVVSNADPEVTFGTLVGRQHLPPRLRRKLDAVGYSTSCLSLFFATDMDLRSAGLDSGNNWFYDHADLDVIYSHGLTDALLRQESPPGMFLTVTTLKDPSKMYTSGPAAGQHTCEAFAFVSYAAFQAWAQSTHKTRPAEYEAMKEDLAWRMVRGLDKRLPGLKDHISYFSLGTPLTNEHYLNATRGNLYGIAKTPDQVGPWAFSTRSPFEGLYLCGASTLSHGVAGVTASGINAAKAILHCREQDLLTQSGPGPVFLPAEQPATWPDQYRRRLEISEKEL